MRSKSESGNGALVMGASLLSIEDNRQEIVRRLAAGQQIQQIAAELEYSPNWLSTLINRSDFKRQFRAYVESLYKQHDMDLVSQKQRLQERLLDEAENMVDEIIRLAKQSERDQVRYTCAREVLAMTKGLGFERVQQTLAPTIVLNAETMQIALQAAAEIQNGALSQPSAALQEAQALDE